MKVPKRFDKDFGNSDIGRTLRSSRVPPRPGWAPDPRISGIRSPIGLVVGAVGSCTDLTTSGVMARRRRRRPHGGQTTQAGSGRRRAPFSTDNCSHTHTARSLACPLLTLSSPARSFPNCIFRYDGAPCGRFLLPCSDRSAGQRNQPSHSTVLARPVCLFVCESASFPCARPLLSSSARSAGQRNQPSHSTVLARPVCLFVCVGAASLL